MPIFEDKSFKDYVNSLPAATENDLSAGNNMPVVSASEVKKMGGENVAKASDAKIVETISPTFAGLCTDAYKPFAIKDFDVPENGELVIQLPSMWAVSKTSSWIIEIGYYTAPGVRQFSYHYTANGYPAVVGTILRVASVGYGCYIFVRADEGAEVTLPISIESKISGAVKEQGEKIEELDSRTIVSVDKSTDMVGTITATQNKGVDYFVDNIPTGAKVLVSVPNQMWDVSAYTGTSYVLTMSYFTGPNHSGVVTPHRFQLGKMGDALGKTLEIENQGYGVAVFIRANEGVQVHFDIEVQSKLADVVDYNRQQVGMYGPRIDSIEIARQRTFENFRHSYSEPSTFDESLFPFKKKPAGKRVECRVVIPAVKGNSQGVGVYGDYAFVAQANNREVVVCSMKYLSIVGKFDIDCDADAHNNSIFFGSQKFAATDAFPLMYVADGKGALVAFRLVGDDVSVLTSVKVQKITFPAKTASFSYAIADAFEYDGNVYAFAYKDDITTHVHLLKFVMPTLAQGDVTLSASSMIEDIYVDAYAWTHQAGFISSSGIYYLGKSNPKNGFFAYDLATGSSSEVDLAITHENFELESLFEYAGELYFSAVSKSDYYPSGKRETDIWKVEFIG